VFLDEFNRTGPTQDIGDPWDSTNASGEWWLDTNTQPTDGGDNALFELTGTGEIFGPEVQQWDDGYSAKFDIIDELVGNVYRILFGAPEDTGRPGVPPLPGADCIIVEYEVGELTDPVTNTSALRIYTRADNVETLVREKYFPPQSVNGQNGRTLYGHWLNTNKDNTFCAWISDSAYPSRIITTGISPPGRYFGAANASGSDLLPIEIDNYELEKATWEDVNGERQPCFACTCVCYDYTADDPDTYPTPIDRKLYPGILSLRIAGQCCTPLPLWPCGDCPAAVDETLTLKFEDSIDDFVGYYGWVNREEFEMCGYPFQFRLECDATGILNLAIYYDAGSGWQQISYIESQSPTAGSIVLVFEEHTCTPIYTKWTLYLNSLSGFPCCLSCSTGSYTIEVFA
jgi:hypothetical protein